MRFLVVTAAALCLAGPGAAESLNYSISYLSGLNLGEATLHSDQAQQEARKTTPWNFDAEIDVSIPGYTIRDQYHATASTGFCSGILDKKISRGERKTEERLTFQQDKMMVKRQTLGGGGSTEFTVPACARDALSFLQFVRKELAEGRLAPRQSIVFGALYEVRFEYSGVQKIQVSGKPVDAERLLTTIKGPASENTIELYFARDAVRTPLLAKIPTRAGMLTVELMR